MIRAVMTLGHTTTPSLERSAEAALRRWYETGDRSALGSAYAPEAHFESHVPGLAAVREGPRAIDRFLARWWEGPAGPAAWQSIPAPGGLTVVAEAADAAGPASRCRHRHLIRVEAAGIRLHAVYPDGPARAPRVGGDVASPVGPAILDPGPLPPALGRHLAPDASFEPLAGGLSGAAVWRVRRRGRSPVVLKRIRPRGDWIMRATRDQGREAALFAGGLVGELPAPAGHPVILATQWGDGWALLLRDVTASLAGPGRPLVRTDFQRVLEASVAALRALAGRRPPGLCSLRDRLRLFSPATARRERREPEFAPKVAGRGWELFAEAAPPDVAAAVLELVSDPGPLVAALAAGPATVIHGDLRPANVALEGDRVLFLDWALAAWAPPAVDLAWALFNFRISVDAPPDALLSDIREAARVAGDEDSIPLALLAVLVQAGCYFGFTGTQDPDPARRGRALADLEWWSAEARAALDKTGLV